MSEGYWKHDMTWGGRDAAGAGQGVNGIPESVNWDDAGLGADGFYWQGPYAGGGPGADGRTWRQPQSAGSVSSRARQAYAAEALRQKDHVTAGLLAVFLGLFGMHKFYLGCNQAGFIMLAASIIGGILTLGLAAAVVWLIAVVEGVVYLTRSQTEFDRIYVLNQRDWF